jgi:hypothetical protein
MAETTSAAPDNSTPPSSVTPAAPRPGAIGASDFSRLPQAEQDRYAALRKPDGGQEYVLRDQLDKEPAADPAKPGTSLDVAPDPNVKHKFGQYELTESEIADLLKHKGETDLKRAAVPADPSQYKLDLPADLPLPPGMTWQWNDGDPALDVARKWAHAQGFSQAQFTDLISQYAVVEARKDAEYKSALKAEADALGTYGPARVDAIYTWLTGVVGQDLAKNLRDGLISRKQVLALEALATKFSGQNVGTFTQAGRDPQHNGRGPLSSMSDEEYGALSAQERYRIARQ